MTKILMHYFQIITITELLTFGIDFEIPYGVSFLPSIIGDPINGLKNSFDCVYNEN